MEKQPPLDDSEDCTGTPVATFGKSLSIRPRLSWRATLRKERLRELADVAMSQLLKRCAKPLLYAVQRHTGWTLKGGGAIWWHCQHIASRPWAGACLCKAMRDLCLHELHDLDFEANMDIGSALDYTRGLSRALCDEQDVKVVLGSCEEWASERCCRVCAPAPVVSFKQRVGSLLAIDDVPFHVSAHSGRNDATGENYHLLRMSVVLEHARGYHLRVPYVDVNCSSMDTSSAQADLVEDVRVFPIRLLLQDLERMLFIETAWQPWTHTSLDKIHRRLRRWIGLVMVFCYPEPTPWKQLGSLLQYTHYRHSQLLGNGAVLRETRLLGQQGPRAFGNLCDHIALALSTDIADQDFIEFLLFIRAAQNAVDLCGQVC